MASELISTTEAYGHEIDLFNEIREIGWRETPFFSSLTAKAPRARAGAAFGHNWKFMNTPSGSSANKHLEGAASPTATKHLLGQGLNHYQIVRNAFGVTRSEQKALGIDDKKEMERQADMARVQHMLSIEMAMCSDNAAVQRTDAVAGQMAGIKSFLTANTDLDMTVGGVGSALTWQILREILKPSFKKGSAINVLMMNDTQKDAIDDILFSKATPNSFNVNRLENNVTMIGQTAYGNNIKVILNPFLADNEIIGYNTEMIHPVLWDPTNISEVKGDFDGIKKEFITELTLHVGHEYAVTRLKGLAV